MRISLLLLLVLVFPDASEAQLKEPPTVRVGVLSLFHPHALILTAHQPLTLTLDDGSIPLSPDQMATITLTPEGLAVTLPDAPERTTRSLSSEDETFTLTVPGKLTRTYRGALALTLAHGELIPVITMPTELAVASIVEAEAPPHASLEALKAQAVVSRSYLLAHPSGHTGFDACDTTHCQFLRSPPLAHSLASIATRATAGLVLTWRPSPESQPVIVPAMYARSCGGHTRAHPTTPEAYPFYRVACSFCQRHPEHWQRTIPSADAPQNERQRLAYNRIHGWSAVPSNQHASVEEHLEGTGTGHGIGLCQVGAADMAAHGATYEKVLTHFFPNTTLIRLP